MIKRIIRLISNTYNTRKNIYREPLGEYCVFGPYDAMNIDEEVREWKDDWIAGDMGDKNMNLSDGKSRQCNIICAATSADRQKEADFVVRMRNSPFLFVSLLIMDRDQMNKNEVIKKIAEINQGQECWIYLTTGKNELAMLHYCKSYRNGLNTVLDRHKMIPAILKTSTIFAIQEKSFYAAHPLYKQIEDEMVSCRLRCFVRDRNRADRFLKELGKDVMKNGAQGMRWFNILGSADLLVEIDSIPLKILLSYYRTGERLTHMNQQYNEAWYNIETEFISDNGGMNYGAEYKQYGGDEQAVPEMHRPAGAGVTADICDEASE